MRTTIDLPEDLHGRAKAIARDSGITLSEAVAMLLRRGLTATGEARGIRTDGRGWPVVDAGRPVTSEDVRELDEEW
ncbi:antitoxin [Euzebya tangerina]|uniref:antitoxin n=1 Tax=Euzebya tangerina TaxID=591198 RepID=UPI000E3131B8|nr:antitoxin [Euzebya tangerina]